MKFKLKRIDWYIIKQFLGTYIFAIALIIAISVVFDINEKIDKFLSPDVPLKAIVFDYYMNFIPYFANLFSPLFTFIAVIFFTSKLADNSEVIAMLASGMSFRRLMLPYAISAGIIALSTFVLNAYIIPPANATRIDFQNKYIKNKKVDYVRSAQLEIEPAYRLFRPLRRAFRDGIPFLFGALRGQEDDFTPHGKLHQIRFAIQLDADRLHDPRLRRDARTYHRREPHGHHIDNRPFGLPDLCQ